MKMKPSIEKMLQKSEICRHNWWRYLSANPSAYTLLTENQSKIDWMFFSKNTNLLAIDELNYAIYLNKHTVSWSYLSSNSSAINILKKYPHEICWISLCENTSLEAIQMLKENPENINWYCLSLNPSAIDILEQNTDKLDWHNISKNPSAIHLLKKYPENINWECLSENPSEEAIQLLEQNPEKVDWFNMSKNPSNYAIDLLLKNPTKIKWFALTLNSNPRTIEIFEKYQDTYFTHSTFVNMFSRPEDLQPGQSTICTIVCLLEQPYIFEYDYAKMKANMDILRKELIMKSIHPSRVCKWIMCDNEDMLE